MGSTTTAGAGYLYRPGASPQTNAVLSTRFRVFTHAVDNGKFTKLGVTSAFNIQEQRNVEAVRGLGFGDIVAELVPGVTTPMTLTINRTALYLANIMQMLGYKAGVSGLVRSLKHQKWPFDIKTEIAFSELVSSFASNDVDATVATYTNNEGGLNNYGNNIPIYAVATVYEGCWMESYASNFQVEQAAVTEDASVIVTDVFDCSGSVYGEFIDSGLNSGDVTGRSLLFSLNS
jgi:hypothetical protein